MMEYLTERSEHAQSSSKAENKYFGYVEAYMGIGNGACSYVSLFIFLLSSRGLRQNSLLHAHVLTTQLSREASPRDASLTNPLTSEIIGHT